MFIMICGCIRKNPKCLYGDAGLTAEEDELGE